MNEAIAFIIITILFLTAIFVYGVIDKRRYRALWTDKIKNARGKPAFREYKDGEFRHIQGYSRNHKRDYYIDDITWHDLNMDDIFKQLNYTYSSAGEEYLYYMLRNPSLENNFGNLEKDIEYLLKNEESRVSLSLALFGLGRTGKYSIYDYFGNLDNLKTENCRQDLVMVFGILASVILLFINLPVGISIVALMLVCSLITYFPRKRKIEAYIVCFSYVFKLLKGCRDIVALKKLDIFQEEKEALTGFKNSFSSFERFSFVLSDTNTGNPFDILMEYIKMFFHLDIIKFFQMYRQIQEKWQEIDNILAIIGRIDATQSISMYRAWKMDYCVPEFAGNYFDVKGLYHPLIKNPVKNDIVLKRGILLTGSNASGKSTFLKAMAVNIILAQSVHTVCCSKYKASFFRTFTSLALNDNIFEGESYYMTEIKSLKRIIDRSMEGDIPIFACVDEVLRGTNTVERISASTCILGSLAKVKGIIAAATHDLELTELLKADYDNYHFEEEINGNDVSFPYKIKEGKAVSRNAIKLLRMVGYEDSIVEAAERMAEINELSGSVGWKNI